MEAIIQSMTKEEREDPSILNASRRRRIAAGCGQPVSKINQLVKPDIMMPRNDEELFGQGRHRKNEQNVPGILGSP